MNKKLTAVLLAAIFIFSFVSCGSAKPEDTVKEYLSAAKAFDLKKIQELSSDGDLDDSMGDLEDPDAAVLLGFYKTCASKISYSVSEAKIDGNTAVVTADVEYQDASDVMLAVIQDYITKAFALAFSGGDSSEEAMSKMFNEVLEEDLKDAKLGTANTQISFSLEKSDNKWRIVEVGDEIVNVMLANSFDALEGIL